MTSPSQPSPTSIDRPLLGWMVAMLAALLAVRVAALALNRTDLFFDEAQYWYWSTEPAFGYYSKPPLIAWIIAASTGVCGTSEFCVRLPSPLIHTATALAIFALGTRLYEARTGALAALAFALLPGVSLSAGIMSTDVPLLLCWTLALIGFAALFETRAWWPALLLGAAFGLGLNAKYAMAWFVLCAGIYLAATPSRRAVLADPRLWAGLALGALLIVPNLAWNQANSFATFAHTADNAKWQGALLNPGKAAEFFLSQFGVFGPLYFAGLLVIVWRAARQRLPEPDRLLMAFCLPLVVAITIQALVSRAHANWAAPAYVAGTVLVIATLAREASWVWLKASYGLHTLVLALLVAGTTLAGAFVPPGGVDPFARTMGWRALAETTRAELARARQAGQPYAAIITDDRALSATLLYYLRDQKTLLRAWRGGSRPMDHFELTRPYQPSNGEPVLLVSLRSDVTSKPLPSKPARREPQDAFSNAQLVSTHLLPAASQTRRVSFFRLTGYAGS
jgi:hypothetical protein